MDISQLSYRACFTALIPYFGVRKAMSYAAFLMKIKNDVFDELTFKTIFGAIECRPVLGCTLCARIVDKGGVKCVQLIFFSSERTTYSCFIENVYEYCIAIEKARLEKALSLISKHTESILSIQDTFNVK